MRSALPPRGQLPLPQKQKLPLRARRRRARILIALAALVVIAGLAWGISWASYLPQFNVSSVSISGTETVPPDLVQTFVETQLAPGTHPFFSPDNIFLFNTGRLSREIVGFFPRIKSASVSRPSLFSTTLDVAIVERQPFALWCTDITQTTCYQMDNGGFIFAPLPQDATTTLSITTPYVFYGNVGTTNDATSSASAVDSIASTDSTSSSQVSAKQAVSSQASASQVNPIGNSFASAHLPGIVALLQLLSQAEFTPQGATITSDQDFSVPLQQGFYIKASFGEDAGTLVNNLQLILNSDELNDKEDQLEYVDLRFGDKVYFKLKGEDQTSASSTPSH
jgi:cell division septal protein FtsQ